MSGEVEGLTDAFLAIETDWLEREDAVRFAAAFLASDWLAEYTARARVDLIALYRHAPRLWQRVDVRPKAQCWPWTGRALGKNSKYGLLDSPAGKTAHRLAWALANGRLPGEGMVIRHRCDNPPCCNPAHLVEGTQRQNVEDMIERGRGHWDPNVCPNGHPRIPENTYTSSKGLRRCKVCIRESPTTRRISSQRLVCEECGTETGFYDMRRHIRNMHNRLVTLQELRDRADRIDGGAR